MQWIFPNPKHNMLPKFHVNELFFLSLTMCISCENVVFKIKSVLVNLFLKTQVFFCKSLTVTDNST